jgi:hypothetical protein
VVYEAGSKLGRFGHTGRILMKNINALLAATLLASFAVAPAQATVLLNLINAPTQTNTPYALSFIAGSGTTAITFAGYQVPNGHTATEIGLFLNNAGASLIGGQSGDFTFTPAPSGSLAYSPGNGLGFAGVTVGSYDTFTQNVATVVDSSYTLRFLYSNPSTNNAPSGFRVEASNAAVPGAVPEPATWAMMTLGFGAVGFGLRRKKVSTRIRFA